jgi:hypothetical protein
VSPCVIQRDRETRCPPLGAVDADLVTRDGEATGVLLETNEDKPVKVEPSPDVRGR